MKSESQLKKIELFQNESIKKKIWVVVESIQKEKKKIVPVVWIGHTTSGFLIQAHILRKI